MRKEEDMEIGRDVGWGRRKKEDGNEEGRG
jgi:hypothetical protein